MDGQLMINKLHQHSRGHNDDPYEDEYLGKDLRDQTVVDIQTPSAVNIRIFGGRSMATRGGIKKNVTNPPV